MRNDPMTAAIPGQPTREQLRHAYVEAWRKRVTGGILSPLELLLADVIALHPEYHGLLATQEAAADLGHDASGGENPFLHLGLHVAVREQIAIDRPPGVRALQQRLQTQTGAAHPAEHAMMEALAETLREGQHAGRAPDEARYLERLRRRLTGRPA